MIVRLLILLSLLPICVIKAQPPLSFLERKITPALKSDLQQPHSPRIKTWWIQTSSIDKLRAHLLLSETSLHIVREYPAIGLVVVSGPADRLYQLLLRPEVIAADRPRTPKEELSLNIYDPSVNQISAAWRKYPLTNGKGLVLSVKENRFDTLDIDFKDRYQSTPLIATGFSTHASIMATLASGAGNSHNSSKGVAWEATVGSASFLNLLPESDADYQRYSITVQNHSYGTGIENYYGADAAAYDASSLANPLLLHVFSAGNSGNQTPNAGTYQGKTGWANLTGSFKMAKNILTVGALDSVYQVPLLSSRGPAYDGRIKPELVAFGEDGSSGAAALTSGTALLVQYLFQQKTGRLPESNLVRAILLNSADDLYTEGPDFISGFGKLNALEALHTVMNNRYETGWIQNGEKFERTFNLPAGYRSMKVTLSWNDLAATVNSAMALKNDLDLELERTPDGIIWQPWVPNAHPDSLQQPAQRRRDSLNTNEQIHLVNPAPGIYRIRVKATALQTSDQFFALAWDSVASDDFEWQSPATGDIVRPGEPIVLRWKSGASIGQLDYSRGDGNWITIDGATPLETGYRLWSLPPTPGIIFFRMMVNSVPLYSDTLLISAPLSLRVGFNCRDSFQLYWNAVPGITDYQLSALGNRFMEPVQLLRDTQVVLYKSAHPQEYYAITPLLQSRQGLRSFTVQYENQGVACYLESFLADLQSDQTIQLRYGLGSLFQIQSLHIEKWQNGAFQSIFKLEPVIGKTGTFTDSRPVKGGNMYRLAIRLKNGQVIYSSVETVYYWENNEFLLYPNPSSGTELTLVVKDLLDGTFQLYNPQGQLVFRRTLNDIITPLQLSVLSKGLYYFKIIREGKEPLQGKLILK